MRPVVLLALAGLIALVLALLTGSTVIAVLVILLAVAGIVVLLRDWRDERRITDTGQSGPPPFEEFGTGPLAADKLSPDISTEPGGPSSDARAD